MRICTGYAAALVVTAAGGASADVLFDYGVSQLGTVGGCWQSNSSGQNFTEQYTNSSGADVRVNQMSYWSCFPGLLGLDFQVKVHQDTNNDGIPDADVVAPFNLKSLAETFEGNNNGFDIYRYDFAFSDILQPDGATYYWGISGLNMEGAQLSIFQPGNGKMWQYQGNAFNPFETGVGDMMIRLEGGVPAPGAAGVLGLGGLLAGRRRR